MMTYFVFLLLSAPLVGSLINGLKWNQKNISLAGFTGSFACFVSFVSAGILFCLPFLGENPLSTTVSFGEWIHIGSFNSGFSFLLDPLSLIMILIITGVGFLIHIFSLYYMSDDARPAKYFSFLNLFVFSMMILVLADNLLLMFLGWEGVGLCSYLLIGFWFTEEKKALSGLKAFVVNRIGDAGFVLGMLLLFGHFGSLHFEVLSQNISNAEPSLWLKGAALSLLIGALGKSAQIPLYVWLPSAMAGPTPVSALIHAATMVTAGIYLIVRMNFLFSSVPEILTLIGWIGAFTAFFSALIACVGKDIKKILAYSTVSQLGYMFSALGVGAFTASFFHLFTHAFFKALLFLCAGVIIHTLKGEQNIYRMGGLRKALPLTAICFLIGALALAGVPPFAGFFSKDEILWSIFVKQEWGVFILLFLTALLTSFYIARLYVLVFCGQNRGGVSFSHKSNLWVSFSLGILAFFSLFAGWLGVPHFLSEILPLHPPHFLAEYLKLIVGTGDFKGSLLMETVLASSTIILGLVVISVACWLYLKKENPFSRFKQTKAFLILENAFGVDAFYYKQITQPILNLSTDLYKNMDIKFLQGFIFLIQKWFVYIKEVLEKGQNGKTQDYILFMVWGLTAGLLCVLLF